MFLCEIFRECVETWDWALISFWEEGGFDFWVKSVLISRILSPII